MGSGFPDDISFIRLEILDLSNTSIKSLPASISSLVALREFFLRGCALLMELPREIGALKNLKVFDFEGTEVICLPKEIAELSNLECLKGSLCGCADHYKKSKGIAAIIPTMTLSKLTQLKVLSIDVNTNGEWWDAEVKNIMNELSSLSNLESLKLYLPTAQSLEQFLQLTRNQQFLCSALSRFRLIVGCHEQYFVSHTPDNLDEEFEKLEKCLKDINGEGNTDVIGKALEHTTALFLDSHWTIEDLSTFKIDDLHKLKFCLLRECNEMHTIVDGGKYYKEGRIYLGEKYALGSLEYLGVYYMEKLQSIWNGPIHSGSLSSLGTLALHTCPNLTTIFTLGLLHNLVNLKDLLVEDCPKVSSLVSIDSSCLETNRFLPSLTKMSLLDLPELMNLSSGLYIAPKLKKLVVINCAKLISCSPMEVLSEDIKGIEGESEWRDIKEAWSEEIKGESERWDWDPLMWHGSKWSSGDLMDQSERDVNLPQDLSTGREPGDPKFIPQPRSSGPGSRLATTSASPLHLRLSGTSLYSSTSPSALIAPRTSGASETSQCTLSRWKKGRLLGKGTIGYVYVGFDSESGQMCVIKEVTDDQTSKNFLKQLNQDITLLSQLSHPNILQYYGSELGEETLSIYSEYVSGGSIQKALREHGPFGEPVIQYYAREILSGLAYLHAKKMMHGNIKGANILVDPDGKIKLADFGTAKHMQALFMIINSEDIPKIPEHLSLDAQDFMKLCLQRDPSARPTASRLLDHPFVRHQATTRVASIIRSNQGRISNHLPWEPHTGKDAAFTEI
ncbi:hypothetical protein RJ639_037400 [Escallonia herrerae]|uniref:Protein kinase domain-containing protein n=1 Tax=Escallonia herrerae TaxID=1293975 RepID=A0AA88WQ36_9ASTE|nr:hypothetical protein RJ639_037400 [Escallonia herrerae]